MPLPQTSEQFNRQQIVKRVVRVGLYDAAKKDFLSNAVHVNVLYEAGTAEDVWHFPSLKDHGLNPLIFRAADRDMVLKPSVFLIFELVIYVKFAQGGKAGDKLVEMSCGWCQLDTPNADVFSRQITHKLPIKGGSPNAEVMIKDADIHTNRSGLKYSLMKVVNSKITSQLTVQLRPLTKFTEETKFHMEMLPSLCLVQKRLLYFVSGFRNYLAEKLLKTGQPTALTTFKKPEGDAIIKTFAKILDSPDISEQLVQIWSEDVWEVLSAREKLNVELVILKTKEFIRKLYPVIYSEEFQYKDSAPTASAAGDQYL